MWPFSKKQYTPSPIEMFISELEQWRKVGETFEYLGRKCVVTGHWDLLPCGFGIAMKAGIRADYADDLGVIRGVTFNPAESKALMNLQPNVGIKATRTG